MKRTQRIGVIGIQPPSIYLEGKPASRRNTSPPFAAQIMAENLRKQALLSNETGVILVMLRAPKAEQGEYDHEVLALDVTEGKILAHEHLPSFHETKRFYGGSIAITRESVDMHALSRLLLDLGTSSVAISAPWTSVLDDVSRLRSCLPKSRFILGGSGLFYGYSAMFAGSEESFVLHGPGFGDEALDSALYLLLRGSSPDELGYSYSGPSQVLEYSEKHDNRALASLRRLSRTSRADPGYLSLRRAFRSRGNSLFPYLGVGAAGPEFLDMLSKYEFTEGDRSVLEDVPIVYMYLTYGCPRLCEYCSSPVLRHGQTRMEEAGVETLMDRILDILARIDALRLTIWDENIRPPDLLQFLGKLEKMAGSRLSDNRPRRLQIEFIDGFYPALWATDFSSLKVGMTDFRNRMSQLGVLVSFGAFFPAENWGFGSVSFYENKTETYALLDRSENNLREMLSLFDYIGTCAGMDRTLLSEEVFTAYAAHLRAGWQSFREVLGERAVIAPFFTQVFPETALAARGFSLLGKRIEYSMLSDPEHAEEIASLYSFGENFASPAFQAENAQEFRKLLERFYAIWEELNGRKSMELRAKYGMTINPESARLLRGNGKF
jgi:hypothetical protein